MGGQNENLKKEGVVLIQLLPEFQSSVQPLHHTPKIECKLSGSEGNRTLS